MYLGLVVIKSTISQTFFCILSVASKPWVGHYQKLQNLHQEIAALDQLGYEIEVIPIPEYNRLTIEMYDREIFRCDIRNLMFNMGAEDDLVCQRAVKAVEEAKFRMFTEKNVPGYGSFSKGRRELHTDSGLKSIQDALPSSTDLIYEIPAPTYQTTKHKAVIDSNKFEEKVGKVTIMEDKNTFRVNQEHQDLDSTAENKDAKFDE